MEHARFVSKKLNVVSVSQNSASIFQIRKYSNEHQIFSFPLISAIKIRTFFGEKPVLVSLLPCTLNCRTKNLAEKPICETAILRSGDV